MENSFPRTFNINCPIFFVVSVGGNKRYIFFGPFKILFPFCVPNLFYFFGNGVVHMCSAGWEEAVFMFLMAQNHVT